MRSCFVLWSAGVDSTYLILRLLEDGYYVNAAYIDIKNNKRKARMELDAIEKMCIQIKLLSPNFDYLGVIYKAQNNSPCRRNLRYKQVPYFMHALLVAPITTYRCIGYVKGDSSIKNLPAIKAIYDQYRLIHNGDLPELVFPLKDASKTEIFTYMQECYPNILRNCVWCEAPQGEDFNPCEICTPCIRRTAELQSMQSFAKSA
jgi:7-cyano-7-deazaguanine synthase in queuosine biosynthesis